MAAISAGSRTALRGAGLPAPLQIMQSTGGIGSAADGAQTAPCG